MSASDSGTFDRVDVRERVDIVDLFIVHLMSIRGRQRRAAVELAAEQNGHGGQVERTTAALVVGRRGQDNVVTSLC